MRILKNKNGQALVEAALTAPLIVFFLFTIIWFGGIMLTWQQITGAARYGTDMIAYTPYDKRYIENEIKNYLCSNLTIGRVLDRNQLEIEISIKDLKEPIDFTLDNVINESLLDINPIKIIENLIGVFDKLKNQIENTWDVVNPKNLINPDANKSFVEIRYNYKAPRVMSIFMQDDHIQIKARSTVLVDSGSSGSRLTERDREARK